jgi:hypothetical protein
VDYISFPTPRKRFFLKAVFPGDAENGSKRLAHVLAVSCELWLLPGAKFKVPDAGYEVPVGPDCWQGTRSRANRSTESDGNIRCSASDRIRVPARPAQHVHKRVSDMRRRTRRSASNIGGGTPDPTVGRADAHRAGKRAAASELRTRHPERPGA